MKLDSIQQFKGILDEKNMIILVKLKLRTLSKLIIYEFDDYKSFIIISENI
jgi:hypothetical protein